jgi:phage terminase large subunit
MEITYIPTGQKILFRGLDEGTKVTSISVPEGVLNFVDIEEAYEIAEDDFNKLDMSIRGELPDGYFKQITLLFNPWSANSWLKPRFFDVPDDDTFVKTTTWQCNEWLGDDDRKIFLKMKEQNPRRYRIEGDGEWGIAEGMIYENFRVEDFNVDEIRNISGIKSAFNLDFGFTDPNAFVCEMVDNTSKRIYVFDEWYKTGVTNKIIAQAIKEKGYGGQRIICDCAEPKSIAELRDEGINAEPSRKGKDSVNHGIQLIQNYEIIIHPKCVEFYKEISNYCWSKDKDGKPTDKPDHEFSHGMDSMRYGVSKILQPDTFSFD